MKSLGQVFEEIRKARQSLEPYWRAAENCRAFSETGDAARQLRAALGPHASAVDQFRQAIKTGQLESMQKQALSRGAVFQRLLDSGMLATVRSLQRQYRDIVPQLRLMQTADQLDDTLQQLRSQADQFARFSAMGRTGFDLPGMRAGLRAEYPEAASAADATAHLGRSVADEVFESADDTALAADEDSAVTQGQLLMLGDAFCNICIALGVDPEFMYFWLLEVSDSELSEEDRHRANENLRAALALQLRDAEDDE